MSVPTTRAVHKRSGDTAAATGRHRRNRPLTPEPTHGQRRVLHCIRDHIRRTGTSPSLRQIQRTLGLASKGAAGSYVEGLRRKRLIRSVHASKGRLQLAQADALPILSTAARSTSTLRPRGDESETGRVAGTIADLFAPRPHLLVVPDEPAIRALGVEPCDLMAVRTQDQAGERHILAAGAGPTPHEMRVLCAQDERPADTAPGERGGEAVEIEGIVIGTLRVRSLTTTAGEETADEQERTAPATDPLESTGMRGWDKPPLNPLQTQVFEVIREHVERTGVGPTLDAIRRALGRDSLGGVLKSVWALERKGWIRREPKKHRSARIVETRDVPLIQIDAAIAPDQAVLDRAHVVDRIAAAIAERFTPRPHYLLKVDAEHRRAPEVEHAHLLAVRATTEARDGDLVLARAGGAVTIARVHTTGTGDITLSPAGPRSGQERCAGEVRIEGLVVGTLTAQPLEGARPDTSG